MLCRLLRSQLFFVVSLSLILGGCKKDEQSANPGGSSSATGSSTAEEAAKSFSAAIIAGDEKSAKALAVDDPHSQDFAAAMARMVVVYKEYVSAANSLNVPYDEKEMIRSLGPAKEILEVLERIRQKPTPTTRPMTQPASGPEEAEIVFNGDDALRFRRINGQWRFYGGAGSERQASDLYGLVRVYGELGGMMRSGQIKTLDELDKASRSTTRPTR
jgi:hypothetical protein